MPIPSRLNIALVVVVFLGALALLWLSSCVEPWYAVLGVGIAYSYLLLTNYALLHEATHATLHPSPRVNYALGVVTGLLFPIPFSMIRTTHQNHHARNRTDAEMFDLYYPHDHKVRKWVQWYGILLGFFWPLAPLGAIIFAVGPRRLRDLVISNRVITGGYVWGTVSERLVWMIRLEVLLIVGAFAAAFWLLDLRWPAVLVCYACFSFNWSTRQYVAHAFSKRDVVDGAWNLRHLRWMSWLLLHSDYDLNHHRRPDVPWLHLPRLSPPDEPRPSYLRQYWRQWLGPRAAEGFGPAPAPQVEARTGPSDAATGAAT